MKLGVDFGTNRIVVAAADRGNFPLVNFYGPDENIADWYPSLVAVRGAERLYGWDAWYRQGDESWTVVRSIKRLLENAGPHTLLDLGHQQISLNELLDGLTRSLWVALRENSNLSCTSGDIFEIVLGVPAHANSNQRFLTVSSFRSAGFEVMGVLNEPSAASIEFGHRQRPSKSGRASILVYDLGGGTFDASLVTLDGNVHHVVASEGIPTIGGDDFDLTLADLALEAAGIDNEARNAVSAGDWFRLLEECRAKKESLNPNSRRLTVDLEGINPAWEAIQIAVPAFYERARPLVEETIEAAEELAARCPDGEFEALYITGGGSELPLVARVLRERFGRRVRRSAYTRSATAIGLAIQADQPGTYRLSERLVRYFGVWREADYGSRIIFDPLFDKGISLPPSGEPNLLINRSYHPVHNIGYFRYLECSHRASDGSPSGEVSFWDEIRFPFDPTLAAAASIEQESVARSSTAATQQIEERYECDNAGSISVVIANRTAGYERTYRLGRWSDKQQVVVPARQAREASMVAAE